MKSLKYILLTFTFSTLVLGISAQNVSDDLIFKALTDEMSRNLTGLKLDKNNPPFFLADYMSDGQFYVAKASLGAIILSKEIPVRGNSIRLMVGDYSLNDENFEDGSRNYNSGNQQLSMPKENDYLAIRRFYWTQFDKSYKTAIDRYSQKLTAVKQQNKEENEKLDDYLKVQPVTLLLPTSDLKFNKSEWEKNIKEVSGIFKNYPKIQSSFVNIFFFNTNCYLINSEGSKIRNNVSVACFIVNASTQASDGEILNDQILFYAPVNSQLPSLESLTKDVKSMAENLEKRCSASVIEEAYQGPVIFEGEALAELFNNKLFSNNGLFTSREPIYAVGTSKGSNNKIDNKIGKRLCIENLSISSEPKTKIFGTTALIGSFEIDAEGVAPENRMILVDKGILKTLLSDRVPTPKVKQSNGHCRFSPFGGYVKSPGVINITYANGQSYSDLIKKVSNETAKSGLEYFYIVRKLETSNLGKYIQMGNSGMPKPIALYKVSTKTGEEEMVRCANVSDFPMLSLKYALGGTSEQMPYNFMTGQSIPASYIIPRAIAFNDISIEKDNSPKAKLPLVENPLTVK